MRTSELSPLATITARAQVAGLHQWPDAPERRAYLRPLHRHLFKLEAELVMRHDERAVEFHDLAETLAEAFRAIGSDYHPDSELVNLGARSCETLARLLLERLEAAGYEPTRVTVSEDGENDGTVYRNVEVEMHPEPAFTGHIGFPEGTTRGDLDGPRPTREQMEAEQR